MKEKKHHERWLQWATILTSSLSILLGAILYIANLEKRIALLEQSNMQINARFDRMEEKIDRIYLALPSDKD